MPEMQQLEQVQQTLTNLQEQLPMWMDVIAALVGFWGLLMWLFGRKLIKASVTVTGLVLGAALGALLFRWQNPELSHKWMYWSAGGALIGAVAFYLLLRLWMAVTLALIVGLIAPVAFAAWQGTADDNAQQLGDAIGQSIKEGADALAEGAERIVGQAREGIGGVIDPDGDTEPANERTLAERFDEVVRRLLDSIGQWWSGMDSASRWVMSALALMGAVIGLVVGLILPGVTSSLVTSLVGSGLMLITLHHLGGRYAESLAANLPDKPGAILLTLGAATVIGTFFQWMFSRRSADNG